MPMRPPFTRPPATEAATMRKLTLRVRHLKKRSLAVVVSWSLSIFRLPRVAQAQSDPHLQMLLGNPSNAVTDPIYSYNNYLILRPQYGLSYSRDRGGAN